MERQVAPRDEHITRLLEIMARLRDPDGGCPWDLEQSFASIAPYTIEEAYEVEHAIASGDRDALRDELGDLLLQVVFHARMAEEEGAFDFDAVVAAICDKLVRRHPHVFGDAVVASAADQTRAWEEMKQAERAAVSADRFADVPRSLPSLARAQKLQKRALERVDAELLEVGAAVRAVEQLAESARAGAADAATNRNDASETLLGRLLFSLVCWAARAGLDAETALRNENLRFEQRART
jgi:ATP diphosphatase